MENKGDSSSLHRPGDEENQASSNRKRAASTRFTPRQIQYLKLNYEICRFPKAVERVRMSEETGLQPNQILFWFQNRRNHAKVREDYSENLTLKEENEKLRLENSVLQEELNKKTANCSSCHESSLLKDNAKLQNEYNMITNQAMQKIAKEFADSYLQVIGTPNPLSDLNPLRNSNIQNPGLEDSLLHRTAGRSTEELVKLLAMDEMFWVKSEIEGQNVLNLANYERNLAPRNYFLRNGICKESSKSSGLVLMNGKELVDKMLDPKKRMNLFSFMMTESWTIKVLAVGDSTTRSGYLQLVYERVHANSPFIQPREFYVLRHCQYIGDGKWIISDISYDYYKYRPKSLQLTHLKHPSGCLIQDLSNGSSKVTWVEHVQVDPKSEAPLLYLYYIQSGLAFGAKKWICTLQTTIERNSKTIDAFLNPTFELQIDFPWLQSTDQRRKILARCNTMLRSFSSLLGKSGELKVLQHTINGHEGTRIMTRFNPVDEMFGVAVCASTSVLIPTSANALFDFLCDVDKRNKWDSLFHDGARVVANIPTGTHSGNKVSFIMPLPESNNLIIQEASTNATGKHIVYVPYEASLGKMYMNTTTTTKCEPLGFAWLPSGFTIFDVTRPNRDQPSTSSGGGSSWPYGCILTAVFNFRFLDDILRIDPSRVSINHVKPVLEILKSSVEKIKMEFEPSKMEDMNNN